LQQVCTKVDLSGEAIEPQRKKAKEVINVFIGEPGRTRNLQPDRYERACLLEGLGEH
jgi:hypothetical protein